MKKILIGLLIFAFTFSLNADTIKADELSNVKVSPIVHDLINDTNTKPEKLKTGDWIWIGVVIVVGITFGSLAYNSRTPL